MAGRHQGIGPHFYKGLDKDMNVQVTLTMRELAERIDAQNYGTQRFLSHLLDVRRQKFKANVEHWEAQYRDDPRFVETLKGEGDSLADAIERLLWEGHF